VKLLVGYGNTPRKLKPFVAFARNSLKVRDEKLLEEVFLWVKSFLPARPEKTSDHLEKVEGGEGLEEEEEEEEEGGHADSTGGREAEAQSNGAR